MFVLTTLCNTRTSKNAYASVEDDNCQRSQDQLYAEIAP